MKRHNTQSQAALSFFSSAAVLLTLLFSSINSFAFEYGEWFKFDTSTKQISDAMTLAKRDGRPILVVARALNCSHCDTFDQRIGNTQAFKNFAADNKIVLLWSNNVNVKNAIRGFKDKGATTTPPFFALFKVKDTADTTINNSDAFDDSQVELLQISSGTYKGNVSAYNYFTGFKINGITIEKSESSWNPDTFINIINSYFPNQFWANLEGAPPEPEDPDNPDNPQPEPGTDQSEWLGIWLTDLAKAKQYALNNDRPLFVEIRALVCEICDNVARNILDTETFLNFARKNKIVLFKSSTVSLKNNLRSDYDDLCNWKNSHVPFFYMFKVKASADITDGSSRGLSPEQVDLLKVDLSKATWTTTDNLYCGKFYHPNAGSIFGIPINDTTKYLPETLISIMTRFFPNQHWDSISPEITQPQGYENATDLGTIPNKANPPMENGVVNNSKWVTVSETFTLHGAEPVKWFKFTGDMSRRFYMYTNASEAWPNTVSYNMKAEFFAAENGLPVFPVLATAESTNLDNFDRGFYFDTPQGTSTGLTYYIKLSGTGGTATSFLTCNFRIHETVSAPASGSITNPHWNLADKGLWSMDVDEAMAEAYAADKPVLAYFSGVTWCPYCSGLEHNLINTTEFTNATSDYYKVIFDYKRRDGTGPSLLTDDAPNGYLAENRITSAQALAKLASNIEYQTQLSLPGSATGDWPNGRIGYPTFVFCRVIQDTRAAYKLEPIARFTSAAASNIANIFNEYDQLFDLNCKEASGNHNTSTNVIANTEGSLNIPVGGAVPVYWTKFTVTDGYPWIFNAAAAEADADATVSISIYDSEGTTLLSTGTGSLKQGLDFTFTPNSQDEMTLWVKVETLLQPSFVPCTLTYSQDNSSGYVTLDSSEIAVSSKADSVHVPLTLSIFNSDEDVISFEYRVVQTESNEAPESYFGQKNWTVFTWQDKENPKAAITIPITVPAETDWTGTKDFLVQIRKIGGNNLDVRQITSTTVKICARPQFIPELTVSSFSLYTGISVNITIPVCAPEGTIIDTANVNLPNGLSIIDNIESNSCLSITGTPAAVTETPVTSTVKLKYNNTVTDSFTFTISVSAMTNDAINKKAFVATLVRSGSPQGSIDGSLMLEKTNDGYALSIITQEADNQLFTTLPGWSEYDVANQSLIMKAAFTAGESAVITVTSHGTGSILFTAANGDGFTGTVNPVTATPNQYAGTYTVALRTSTEAEGLFSEEGWISMTVNDSGIATYSIQLYDDSSATDIKTAIYDKDSQGAMLFYLPLNWNEEINTFTGKLSGVLTITPLSQRPAGENNVCISGCGDNASVWQQERNGEIIQLTPCGASFVPGKNISETVGTTNFFFVTEKIPNAVAPDYIQLMEQNDNLTTTENSILSKEFGNVAVNKQNSTFTASMNVFKKNGTNPMIKENVNIHGIIVQTTQLCCDISANVALCYGYYKYDGEVYKVRVYPTAYQKADIPALQTMSTSNTTINLRCVAGTKSILYKRLDTNQIYFANWTGSYGTVSIDSTSPWQFEAMSSNVNNEVAESEIVEVALYKGAKTYTYGASDSADVKLEKGWNLVGIPWNVAVAKQQNAAWTNIFELDTDKMVYARPTTIETGKAYWIFVNDDTAPAFSFQGTELTDKLESPIPEGWSMQTFSDFEEGATFWRYSPKGYEQVQENADGVFGVMIHK